MKKHKYVLEAAVFVCGAVVMVFELVGSRILGPYFGTSIFVWTSLIGIILGSLSLGYYYGGRVADENPNYKNLAMIIFFSAIFIGLTLFIKDPLLLFLQTNFADVKVGSAIGAVILFLPTSFLLGMVSPYAVKLKVDNLETSGSTVGDLYAISTAGSIIGTFLSGFYLIPQFGTNRLLVMMTIALVAVSLAISAKKDFKLRIVALLLAVVALGTVDKVAFISDKDGLVDVDTPYSRIWIYDYTSNAKVKIRKMGINNENHSSMFLNSDELVNEYTKYYHLAGYFKPDLKKTLMLGGAGYSFPKDYLLKYPDATMDVVEIDPKVTELAKKYFNLKDDPRLKIYHEDGRVYLNKTQEKYDVIFGDAFGSRYSIPYQLTTKEAVRKNYDVLNDDGVVILNIISAIEGDGGQFLRAEYATYKSIFPQVYFFPVQKPGDGESHQNVILVALKKDGQHPFVDSGDRDIDAYLGHRWKKDIDMDMPVLTDDYAPVDYYISKAI
ncbi:MAG: fused MFS/spermidine synthase [Leadbetterella sp.]|nr:fused MFS/spermidine synthase [Leadbetterella sp.]